MKVLFIALAIVLLGQSTEAGWRRFARGAGRVVRTASDAVRDPARVAPDVFRLATGKRDSYDDKFYAAIADDQMTPEELQELLDLSDSDLAEILNEFDIDGDGVLVESEFVQLLEVFIQSQVTAEMMVDYAS